MKSHSLEIMTLTSYFSRLCKISFVLVPLLFAVATSARAQEAEPVLPDIAPQDVEIRGELEIALPSLQRQPLSGFNPPPKLVQIPADRKPYAAPYRLAKEDLPPTPITRPEPPNISSLAGKPPINGEFEAAAGRYLTREVRGRTVYPLSPTTSLYARADYEGSDGFIPDEGVDDHRTDFDNLEGKAGIQTVLKHVALGFEMDGLYESYSLYGSGSNYWPAFYAVPYAPRHALKADALRLEGDTVPTRTGSRTGAGFWLRSHGSTESTFRLDASVGSALFNTTDDWSNEYANRTRAFDGTFGTSVETPVPGGTVIAQGRAATLSMDAGNATVASVDVGGGYRFLYRNKFSLTLGGALVGFSADVKQATLLQPDAGAHSIFVPAPSVRVEFYPAHGMRFYARSVPRVAVRTLTDLHRTNPYVVSEPFVEPDVSPIDAEAGISMFAGRVQLSGKAGYQYFSNYMYFEPQFPSSPSRPLVFLPLYDNAQIAYAGGDVSFVLPGGFHATGGATLRRGRLSESRTIPYFGPIKAQGMLSWSFADAKGLLQLTGTFESRRYSDTMESVRVPSYFDIDTALTWSLTPSIGLVGRVKNISGGNLEKWAAYPEAPLVVTGGVRVRW